MGYFDTMQVCRKSGHKITDMYDSYPDDGQKYCGKCGSETIYKCPVCDVKIRGFYHVEGVVGFNGPEVPLNCHNCGKSYPWKKNLILRKNVYSIFGCAKYIFDKLIGIIKR